MRLEFMLLLFGGLVLGTALFLVISKLFQSSYFSRKTWYSVSSNVKPPSSCCSAQKRNHNERMFIL